MGPRPINLELMRKFLIDYLPTRGQADVNRCMLALQQNPLGLLNGTMQYMQRHLHIDDDKAVAATNGVLMGIALAYCMTYEEMITQINDTIEQRARVRGENVVGFLERKKQL